MTNNDFESKRVESFYRGEYSDKDELYINNIFCDSSKERELKNLLSKQFNELIPEDELNDKNLDHILHRINFEICNKKSKQENRLFSHIIRWSLRIAALLLFPISVFIGIRSYNEVQLKKETWVEINAPAWTRAQFSLPDGTLVWLNSNSSIKYNENFNFDRNVILTGEAFFDVFKDKKRPFVVNASEISVKVLGTRFNVSSYENENTVEVVLEEGELLFNNKAFNNSISMEPNDRIIYNKDIKEVSKEVVQPQKYLAWTEGKLIFRNDPLDVIARRLERWYNIDVEISSSALNDIRWRATFIDENLKEVLDYMKKSLPIDVIIENGNLKLDETYAKTKVRIIVKK